MIEMANWNAAIEELILAVVWMRFTATNSKSGAC